MGNQSTLKNHAIPICMHNFKKCTLYSEKELVTLVNLLIDS